MIFTDICADNQYVQIYNTMKTYLVRLQNTLFLSLVFCALHSNAQVQSALKSFMQTSPSAANAIPYGNNKAASHYIQSDDAKIYYEVYGKGKPLVVLHGGVFGSTLEMGQLIDSLSKSYRVIAVSTRGHGRSEMGKGAPSYPQKARDVNAVIKAETKDSVTVLGFSDGAYTAYYLAGEFPEKVKKVIAIGAGEWKKGSRTFNITRQMVFGLDSLYWKQQMTIRPEPQNIDSWFVSINTYYNSLQVGKEVFQKVKCPMLLLAGELDQNAPLPTVIAAYHLFPKVQLGIIPNAPHPAFQTNFNAVWADILPFLQQ
jgi:pimeloyl-ACP methyl ester carboxylesterase